MINIQNILEEAPKCGSNLEQDQGHSSPRLPLHNTLEPAYETKTEKGYHRLVAFLVAEGYNDKEIAAKVDRSPVTISYLRKQPHIERLIVELIHGRGDAAMDKLHKAAEEAADALISNLREAVAEGCLGEVRQTANSILDRKYGKPNQPTTVTTRKTVEEMTVAEIDQRLSELEKQREIKSN